MIFIIWLVVVVVSIFLYFWKSFSRYSKYGVKYLKPVPIFGNCLDVVLKKRHISDDFQMLYKAFPGERFVGRFNMTEPMTMIRDLDLIKQVTIKDFEYFLDHRSLVDETVDTLFGRSILSLRGQEWKDMRSTLSPVFTAAKIRAMVPFMMEVNEQMFCLLRRKIDSSTTDFTDVDCKDLMTRYCNDVMASCGFGLKVDSHNDPNNEFYVHAKTTAHFGFRRVLVYFGYLAFPSLMKKFNIKLLNEDANDYFKQLFIHTMLEREKNKIVRPDMVHLLTESRKGNLKHADKDKGQDGFSVVEESYIGRQTANRWWSDEDLVSQALFFFLANFETISTAMCFLLHELAVHPEVQDRLLEEIRECEARNKRFDYDTVLGLKYLDMVVSELQRLWPFGVGIERICNKNYNLGKPNDKATRDFVVEKGESIIIPIKALHHNPDYFPDPSKFDPERFSEENKVNIKPYTYLPFGSGPRNCIGSRFALLEMKVAIYHLLLHFQLSPAEKTTIPVKLVPTSFTHYMDGGHWVRFKIRDQTMT